MRVWQVYLITGVPRVNGVAVVASRLSVALAAQGVEVTVFLLDDGGVTSGVFAPTAVDGELVVAPDLRSIELDWRRRWAAGEGPDVVHFHEPFRPQHAWLARRLRQQGIPYVVSTHSALAPPNLARKRWTKAVYSSAVGRAHLRDAAMIVALTDHEADDIRRHLGPATPPLAIIPNALEASWLGSDRWKAPARGRRRLVTLCRYDVQQKGLDTLSAIAARLPSFEVAVHGEADRNEPAKLAALRATAPANFVLAPPLNGPAIRTALASADFFVQPSRWEGLSASLAEAMAFGMPCAVSTAVAGTLPFRERDLGLVLDDDPRSAARQLETAVADPQVREGWAAHAAAYARDHFRPDSVAAAHLTAYGQARACVPGTAT